MAKRLTYTIDVETRRAIRATKNLTDEATDLESALEDAEGAGAVLARAIEDDADRMIAAIKDAERQVELLQTELGSDYDRGAIAEAVGEFKRLGLTADDVEADVEALAAAMRRTDDVQLTAASSSFDDVDAAIGRVDTSTGKARSSMTGFAGGTIGEMPLVAESLGPVGEGLGQLTEGFLEGEVGVKEFVAAGVGMAGVGLVVQGLTSAWEKYRAEQEKREERIRAATEALLEQSDAVDTLSEAIDELSESSVPNGGLVKALLGDLDDDQIGRLNAALVEVGLTHDDLFSAIRENGDDLSSLMAEVLGDSTDLSDDVIGRMVEAITATGNVDEALVRLATGPDLDLANRIMTDPDHALRPILLALEEVEDAVDETDFGEVLSRYLNQVEVGGGPAARALEEIRDAHPTADDLQIYTLLDAALAQYADRSEQLAADAQRYEDAYTGTGEALVEVGDAAGDTADDVDELTDSFAELRDELDDRSSYLDLADEFAGIEESAQEAWDAAVSGSEEADQLVRDHEQNVISLKEEVLDYADAHGDIPDEVISEILALLDEGDWDYARTRLEALEADRVANLEVDADTTTAENDLGYLARDRAAEIDAEADVLTAEADLEHLTRDRTVNVIGNYVGGGRVPSTAANGFRARGGNVGSRGAVAGENGRPELVDGALVIAPTAVPAGANVTGEAETARKLARAGAPAGDTYLTVNIGPGVTAADTAQMIRDFERRSGRRLDRNRRRR